MPTVTKSPVSQSIFFLPQNYLPLLVSQMLICWLHALSPRLSPGEATSTRHTDIVWEEKPHYLVKKEKIHWTA